MFIEPLDIINQANELNKIKSNKESFNQKFETGNVVGDVKEENFRVPFQSLFIDAAKEVIRTDQVVNEDAVKLATGQSDNLHQYSIDVAKAQLSLELLVELRNKALESYQEISKMTV